MSSPKNFGFDCSSWPASSAPSATDQTTTTTTITNNNNNNHHHRSSSAIKSIRLFSLFLLFATTLQLNFGAIQPTQHTYQRNDDLLNIRAASAQRISLTSAAAATDTARANEANLTELFGNVRTGRSTHLLDNWTEIDIARQNATSDEGRIRPIRMASNPRRHPQSVTETGSDLVKKSSAAATPTRGFISEYNPSTQSKHRVLKLLMKDSGNEMEVMDQPSGKIRKVVRKKIKLSKDKNENWMKQLLVNSDKSGDRWRQIYKLAAKSKIVCFHVLPAEQQQQPNQPAVPQEQFNLVKKCYPLAQILQTYRINHQSSDDQGLSYQNWPKLTPNEEVAESRSNYSPIINPNIMLMRSAVMSATSPDQLFTESPIISDRIDIGDDNSGQNIPTNSELLDSQSSFNKEQTVEFGTRTEPNAPLVSGPDDDLKSQPTIQLNGTESYLSLYEYKPEPEFKVTNQLNETQSEGLSESSSDYFNVFTNIEQNGNSIQPQELNNKNMEGDLIEIQAPMSPTNELMDKINSVKDLWQVNRRKKQISAAQAQSNLPQVAQSVPMSGETGLVDGMLVPRPRIPKLLLPKVNRPAMYSLNGYVPKPSLQRLASINQRESIMSAITKKSAKELKKQKRKRKNRKVYQDDSADDIDVSESVSQRRRLQTAGGSPNSLVPNNSSGTRADEKKTGAKNGKSASRNKKQWPTFSSIPKTSFECNDRDGVYADVEAGCQVWHICQNGATHSFLCPNGTIFNAKNGVCDWWYNSRCEG